MSECPHCDAGHQPTWQPHSSEWVHRWAPTAGNGGRFSITLCVPKTRGEDGKNTVPVRRDLLRAYERSTAMLQKAVDDPEAGPLVKQAFDIVQKKGQP